MYPTITSRRRAFASLVSLPKRHAAEIGCDPVLRYYGVALAFINILSGWHWLSYPQLSLIIAPDTVPICWPMLPYCEELRILSPGAITTAIVVFIIASIWNARLFLDRRSVSLAYACLVILSVVKYALVLQDFRLTLNHHYMAGWIVAAFLFAPHKRITVTRLIVCMYFWAGVLKVDPAAEWLSGAAFYGRRPLGMPVEWIPLACAYVIVLELIVVFGALSSRPWIQRVTLAQLIAFHFASFWVVGWFYPFLMFALLSIFVTPWLVDGVAPGRVPVRRTVAGGTVWIVCLSIAQVGRLLAPGDAAITGEGRLLALNMFDAPVECRATLIRDGAEGIGPEIALVPSYVNTRTACDPLVYRELVRGYCRLASGAVRAYDVRLETKKASWTFFRPVVATTFECTAIPRYSLFTHNPWILPQ